MEFYHHHDNSLQDAYSTRKAFAMPPGMCSFSWITTLCILQKDWSFLLQILPRKVHFWMHDWRAALCQLHHFPFKWVQWWPSMPLVRTTLCTLQKDWSFLLQILPRKVHFWMHDWWHLFLLCQFKHNDGYLCLWQGLLVLFERTVVNECHSAKNALTAKIWLNLV